QQFPQLLLVEKAEVDEHLADLAPPGILLARLDGLLRPTDLGRLGWLLLRGLALGRRDVLLAAGGRFSRRGCGLRVFLRLLGGGLGCWWGWWVGFCCWWAGGGFWAGCCPEAGLCAPGCPGCAAGFCGVAPC